MSVRRYGATAATVVAAAIMAGTLAPAAASAEPPAADAEQVIASAVQHAGQPAAVDSNADVTLPTSAGAGIEIDSEQGSRISLSIPAQGSADVQGSASVFDDTGRDNSVAVESTADGVRAIMDITGPQAPERYAFRVGGDAASLVLQDDGSATVLNADGAAVGTVATPWARDASATSIPTYFEVQGTTLTQVVEHRSGAYAYPIVADPFWSDAWKVVKCVAAVGGFIAGNLFLIAKVRKVGGIARAVDRLRGAANWANRYKAALAIFGDVSGLGAVISECG